MSKFLKKDQINSSWYEIDAQNAVVGRLAAIISKIIRGKMGIKKGYKKALITLKKGQSIDLATGV